MDLTMAQLVEALKTAEKNLDKARRDFDSFFDALRSSIESKDYTALALDLVERIFSAFRDANSGAGQGGGFFSNLLKLHEGGVVPGPRGREVLAVLQAGERVLPLDHDSRMAARGAGMTIQLGTQVVGNVDAPVLDAVGLNADRIAAELAPAFEALGLF